MTMSGTRAAIRWFCAALFLLICGPAWGDDPAPSYPTDPKGWSDAATRDINAAYAVLVENHPGIYDPANPGFRDLLKKAQQQSLELAAQTRDAAGYTAAISRFRAVLNDGHAGVFPTLGKTDIGEPTWPGFIAVWRGNGLYVFGSEADGIARGAKVVSCDGVAIKDLIVRNVFRFMGRADQPGQWWSIAGLVFADMKNPFVTLPKSCVFETSGKTSTQTLAWRPVGQSGKTMREWSNRGVRGDVLAPGMTEPEPGIIWIAMPTFSLDEKVKAVYGDLIAKITSDRSKLLGARAIVLDLRGNHGGSSSYSRDIAGALWGKASVDAEMKAHFKDVEIWWRASPGNTEYVRRSAGGASAKGFPDMAASWTKVAEGMQAALDKGDKFYVARNSSDAKPSTVPAEPPLKTPVYVIVPGQCASACNDALDVFTRFPNTKLIGAPSSADSNYLEVRLEKLPSGLASVVIPNKIWVHRPRASGGFYSPAITLSDLDWSTAAFLVVVIQDLAERKARGG
jgi:hypothetical protein